MVASSTVAVEPAWAGDVFARAKVPRPAAMLSSVHVSGPQAKRAKQANDAAAKPIEKAGVVGFFA